jgi:hypothetical protein
VGLGAVGLERQRCAGGLLCLRQTGQAAQGPRAADVRAGGARVALQRAPDLLERPLEQLEVQQIVGAPHIVGGVMRGGHRRNPEQRRARARRINGVQRALGGGEAALALAFVTAKSTRSLLNRRVV